MDAIECVSAALRFHGRRFVCRHCHCHNHWIGHGYRYKQLSIDHKIPVGKRILCSNRFGHGGCGRTHALYVHDRIPFMSYGLTTVCTFLSILIFCAASVEQAYCNATGAVSPRNAWRWVDKLYRQLSTFRTLLGRCDDIEPLSHRRSTRLNLILSTLLRLFDRYPPNTCTGFQLICQKQFI